MKRQFNLEEYNRLVSEGKEPKIVTRDGSNVRIICTDLDDDEYVVAAQIKTSNGDISLGMFKANGSRFYSESPSDLFFAPEKHEGWILVAVGTDEPIIKSRVYQNRQVVDGLKAYHPSDFAVAHIKWEE